MRRNFLPRSECHTKRIDWFLYVALVDSSFSSSVSASLFGFPVSLLYIYSSLPSVSLCPGLASFSS